MNGKIGDNWGALRKKPPSPGSVGSIHTLIEAQEPTAMGRFFLALHSWTDRKSDLEDLAVVPVPAKLEEIRQLSDWLTL